jgi:hypothetical protein
MEKYREDNDDKIKEQLKEYYERNEEKLKEQQREYYDKNRDRLNKKHKEYYENNQEQLKEQQKKYLDDRTQNAYDSVMSGSIIDRQQWDLWCDAIKRSAKANKHPYCDDLTNDVMFGLMIKGCYYCGDIATTIDRLNSVLDHTLKNCVGCCYGCNISKGYANPSMFIRKACYRSCGEYVDDVTNIWYVNQTKPSMGNYKIKANKKEVPFELTKEKWEQMILDDCEYCHRSPMTWFGIDRVIPENGYVTENVVTCCYDCNLDKHINNVDMTKARNERIWKRVQNGELMIEEPLHPA